MSMKFRALDADKDWTFGGGLGNYFTDERAIEENIRTRLLIFLGEVFWALDAGVDWWNLLGGKNPAAQQNIILQCRTVIINSYGVVRVNSVSPVLNAQRNLSINYNIDTYFTRGITQSVQVN